MWMTRYWAALVLILGACTASADAIHAFNVQDLVHLSRITDVETSPDGKQVTYTLVTPDSDTNRERTSIRLLDTRRLDAAGRPMTGEDELANSAIWSRDGRYIFFLSSSSGSQQVWRMTSSGAERLQVTKLPLDVSSFRLSPRMDRIFVTMEV